MTETDLNRLKYSLELLTVATRIMLEHLQRDYKQALKHQAQVQAIPPSDNKYGAVKQRSDKDVACAHAHWSGDLLSFASGILGNALTAVERDNNELLTEKLERFVTMDVQHRITLFLREDFKLDFPVDYWRETSKKDLVAAAIKKAANAVANWHPNKSEKNNVE